MVGPLAIVHQDEHRGLIGDVHHQPVQAVQGLETNIGAQRLPPVGLEQPGRGTGSACEQVGVPRVLVDHRLQQLPHHAERKRLLKLGTPRLQRRHPLAPGRRARRARQRRLAHAGGPLDKEQRPFSGAGAIQPLTQRLKLTLALEPELQP